ncbi:MAG: hypothetical protein ACYCUM_09080 [Solirubrobacteraceae bacterium]
MTRFPGSEMLPLLGHALRCDRASQALADEHIARLPQKWGTRMA